ncbi:antimicrobial peptide resistance and lipid A acylation protein PagP [Vibrio phage phiVC8]|uniref:Uncharacterized protein n=1 Tax=Vibrio phage phiVC8 TaxID=1076759 RepID=G3FFQ1_BPVC8|nr:antimicrobial peptide resistance and lipid A acylation protein PagP [Vibrio phage phiVC8]AEM62939.1 hypothetical protein phiVC8_p42 [Vibrio phage phiVC8]
MCKGLLKAATALTAAVIIGATNAHGAEWSVITPIGSKHLGAEVDYNEANYGLGLQYGGFGVMWYKNSYSNNSIAAFYSAQLEMGGDWGVGSRFGMVSGYEGAPFGSLSPFAQPFAYYDFGQGRLNVGVLPSFLVSNDAEAVITFDYEYRF